jgi:hypothetical protein
MSQTEFERAPNLVVGDDIVQDGDIFLTCFLHGNGPPNSEPSQ